MESPDREAFTCSFMVPGHTKFLPDGAFGLVKQKYRKTPVSCISDIAKMVDDSSVMNTAQVMGYYEDGREVLQRGWNSYLSNFFKAIPSITSLYHFRYGFFI